MSSHQASRRHRASSPAEADIERAREMLGGPAGPLRAVPEPELTALLQRSVVVRLDVREPLFGQGDDGHAVVLVLQGHVKLSIATFGGREVVLDIAGPGAIFGELAVLNGSPRAGGAIALSPCRVMSIHGDRFREAVLRRPEVLLELFRIGAGRLHAATARMTDLVELPASARLAKALLQLASLSSPPDAAAPRIDLALSQRELGSMTGLTRESINKHLAAWRDKDWIRLSGHAIDIVHIDSLRQLLADYETAE
jgi:CRP/FNR family transcriptional regulator, cyclic AMP receptor protein